MEEGEYGCDSAGNSASMGGGVSAVVSPENKIISKIVFVLRKTL